jgi:hypothetical protein
MIRSRLGLKALGLCAMLVGMFAFAGVAQAETNSFWLVAGAKLPEGLKVEVGAKTDVAGSLLTTLGGKEIHLRCPTINLVGAKLVEPTGKIEGKIDFSGCKFFALEGSPLAEKEKTACEPSAEGIKGLIITNSITGLIVLHTPSGGTAEPVIEAVPSGGGSLFATVALGEECAFGELLKVGNGENKSTKEVLKTKFFLKDCKEIKEGKCEGSGALVDRTEHLVEELSTLTKLYVNGGETTATVHGSALAFLSDTTHKGMTFAAHAG